MNKDANKIEKILAKLSERFLTLGAGMVNKGELYIVGTPIGNLNDLSPRALVTLAQVDVIAAEDTRHTAMLLAAFDIHNCLISYHEHNMHKVGGKIIDLLTEGKSVALVTDAGMPAISDPGQELCALCHVNHIKVNTVPGPTAVALAAAASGLVKGEFYFATFLPADGKMRKSALAKIMRKDEPVIMYESPHRLANTLNDLVKAGLGDCELCIARELTKIHESVRITTPAAALEELSLDPVNGKGEFVLVLANPSSYLAQTTASEEVIESQAEREVLLRKKAEVYLHSKIGLKQAARELAAEFGLKTNVAYDLLLEIKSRDMV